NLLDVLEELPVRPDYQRAAAFEPVAVRVKQERDTVQADGGLTGPGRALYAHGFAEVGPDQLVLLGLDGGDDVAHRPDARPLDLGGQDAALGAQLLAAVQVLVLEAGQLTLDEPEPPPHRDTLRVGDTGPVERPGQRRT